MTKTSGTASDCVFCAIARGTIAATRIYESDRVVAFLDIRPVRPGHVQVIARDHHPYFDSLPPDVAAEILGVGQMLAPALRSLYKVERVAFLFSGNDIAHAHAHVIPMVESSDVTSRRYIREPTVTFGDMPRVADEELDRTAAAIRQHLPAGVGQGGGG